ncbi:uncharacterized protein [Eurosta solidaginis]|uniref:uncharacterized protein n=1 Tax=Eurosta solidaginis TaxID=178769 RepID=UPI0035314773
MLVAAPGQSATYSLLGTGAPKKSCLSSSATPKSTSVTTSNGSVHKSGNSAASTLMKTISVRLNRGTEFIKDTVHKALINSTTSSKNTTSTASNVSFRNNINNSTTVANDSLKHNKTSAVAGASSTTSANKPSYSSVLETSVPNSSTKFNITQKEAHRSSKTHKQNTVPPTIIHRYPQDRSETNSTDSINKELCHFKPIISAPTIRWKCGSKSRGAVAIKMPVACLATNMKNLNCDDCSIVSAGNTEIEQPETEAEKQEIDAKQPFRYHIYSPKPSSTLLTTIITSPTHQSAFVRLVAQMKTLVKIQQTAKEQTHSRTTKNIDDYKMQHARRSRPSETGVSLKMSQHGKSSLNLPLTQIVLRSRKESFLHLKGHNLPTDIVKKGENDVTKAEGTKLTSTLPLHVLTKKGKRNPTKSRVINIVAFAQKGSTEKTNKNKMEGKSNVVSDIGPNSESKHKQRKRKSMEISSSTNKVQSSEINEKKNDPTEPDVLPPLRKSARLSKDGSTDLLIDTVKRVAVKKRKLQSFNKRLSDSFSPPMTRSRLKELLQQHSITSESSSRVQ